MIRLMLMALLLLLIPSLASAGQGMGPGPGIYRVAVVTPPVQVTGVSTSTTTSPLTASWSAVSGATSYNVYYSTTNNSAGATKKSLVKSTSYSIAPDTSPSTYYVWVSAQNASGEGPLSAVTSASVSKFYIEKWADGTLDGWTGDWADAIWSVNYATGGGSHTVSEYLLNFGVGSDEDGYYSVTLTSPSLSISSGYITFWYSGATPLVYIDGVQKTVVTDKTEMVSSASWYRGSVQVTGGGSLQFKLEIEAAGSINSAICDIAIPIN